MNMIKLNDLTKRKSEADEKREPKILQLLSDATKSELTPTEFDWALVQLE